MNLWGEGPTGTNSPQADFRVRWAGPHCSPSGVGPTPAIQRGIKEQIFEGCTVINFNLWEEEKSSSRRMSR